MRTTHGTNQINTFCGSVNREQVGSCNISGVYEWTLHKWTHKKEFSSAMERGVKENRFSIGYCHLDRLKKECQLLHSRAQSALRTVQCSIWGVGGYDTVSQDIILYTITSNIFFEKIGVILRASYSNPNLLPYNFYKLSFWIRWHLPFIFRSHF